ncbi:hypothetical protein [Methyloversatilis sp. XJ19-49]|uniref:hypothetical protein n=1 Tax=Methyloversatilis sp. XJ19-49 TaxID=2963429 RepID=UPI00211CF7CE|nr:hypothetical protein [Methyloversatilis sp. XJ19-49]
MCLLTLVAFLFGCAATPEVPADDEEIGLRPVCCQQPLESSPLSQVLPAAHPRTGNAARAKALLETLLAATDDASRAQHPYARTLLDQINERQRLDAANQRLLLQAERHARQLKDSQLRTDELQRKIDALADIERTPPSRTPKRALAR